MELARRLDRLEQQLDDSANRQEDPLVADSMADALNHARRQGVAEQMRQAGRGVEQNRIGQANQGQRQGRRRVARAFGYSLQPPRERIGPARKKLREAEGELAQIAKRQQGLEKKSKAAAQLAEPERRRELERLAREQRQLQEEAERFSRKLERLQAEQAGANVGKAGGEMGQASDSGASGDAAAAAEQAEAAEKDLADAQRELAARRQQAESDLAQEQLARMEDAVASMHERQQKLIGETVHYQLREAERDHLTRAEAASVRELARNQLSLRDEMQELAKTLAGAEVFQFVLELGGGDMTRAAERLDRRDVGDETLRAENGALDRIAQLQDALRPDSASPKEESQDEGGGEGQGEGQQQPQKPRSVAELKLLKAIQEQINNRTSALADARRESASVTSDQELEYQALSREQGRLADLVTNMMQTADERPEDNPERLPDVRQDTGPRADDGKANEDKATEELP